MIVAFIRQTIRDIRTDANIVESLGHGTIPATPSRGGLHRRRFPIPVGYVRRTGLQFTEVEDAAQAAIADKDDARAGRRCRVSAASRLDGFATSLDAIVDSVLSLEHFRDSLGGDQVSRGAEVIAVLVVREVAAQRGVEGRDVD